MKYIMHILFASLFIANTFANKEEITSNNPNSENKIIKKDGIDYEQYYYDSGKLKAEVPLINGCKNGALIERFENGNIRSIISFLNGKFCIISRLDEQGHLLSQMSYAQSGKLDGYTILFHKNSLIRYAALYKDGMLQGKVQHFDDKGVLIKHD